MTLYSIEPRTRKYVKEREFLSFARNVSNKYWNKLLDTATKTGLDTQKTASRKLVHKTAEATGEFIGARITDEVVKPKPISDIN